MKKKKKKNNNKKKNRKTEIERCFETELTLNHCEMTTQPGTNAFSKNTALSDLKLKRLSDDVVLSFYKLEREYLKVKSAVLSKPVPNGCENTCSKARNLLRR